MTEKACNRCQQIKPLSAFYGDRSKRLRVGTYCKACSIELARDAHLVRKATPKDTPATKRCTACRVDLPASSFWKQPASRDGLMPECTPCRKDRARRTAYGMRPGEYDQMLQAQGGACAICSQHEKLAVDHCHGTGTVRGLLCSNCNTALGLLGDNPGRLQAAIDYLNLTKKEQTA